MNLKKSAEKIVSRLLEAPVGTYATIPSDPAEFKAQKRRGWNEVDRDLVTHPTAIEKVKSKFAAKLDYNFDLYFAAIPKGFAYRETGAVNASVLKTLGIDKQVKADPGSITVVFTQNTAGEKVPMTTWTMAHRFAHAMSRPTSAAAGTQGMGTKREYGMSYVIWSYKEFEKAVESNLKLLAGNALPVRNNYPNYGYGGHAYRQDNPEIMLKHIGHEIGTMKSARDRKLRNSYEFAHELFAQYLIQGEITLNRYPESGSHAATRSFAYGRPQKRLTGHSNEQANAIIEELEHRLNYLADNTLQECVGHIFVM